ncbi:Myosin type-2 heavy chain 1 [Linderina macrospora]|uniref:Myosin type-2 heavy chain 1 n=1 Tax=Linderina macrospora TaxID=4868 RepID=A0ACC1JGK1_9FUNG|nr:Myosin type-2 heavy chain 1 [Linderina macrospora]
MFAVPTAEVIAKAVKLLEPYTKGAKAWFADGDEAWTKATLVQRKDDTTLGISRLVFVRDDSRITPTAELVAQTSGIPMQATEVAAVNGLTRQTSVRAPTSAELQKIVARGSRLTGGRISSTQRVENSYVVDIAFSELVEEGVDGAVVPALANPPILDCAADLTALSYLHEPAVLYNLMCRYQQKQIYTYSGVVLVAMNPFESVEMYTGEIMQRYARGENGHDSPHLFAIAEDAYQGMVKEQRNQTIIVYGESGSGKTTSAKYIMRYFAQAHHADTNSQQMSTVENQILATNPVFESFGNAKTTRNDNSSRFGKFLDIKFERRRQQIVGGRIRTFLLERSRVAYQPPTERNYHIFYQLLAGADSELREQLSLDGKYGSWEAFHYTCQGGSGYGTIAGVDDGADFTETDASLEMVGIDAQQRRDIWRTLSGILHLGNVGFAGSETIGSYVDSNSEEQFAIAARLLGVEESKLRQWLTKRQIVTRHDHILAKVNKTQALVIRDSIAKFIYARLFDWILGPINASLMPAHVDESLTSFVGVLDIYGFEHFEHNSFEQFCINYANEKLQQGFNHHVFKLEQEEYKREQLTNWTFIGFQDNQPCIDLIEGKPIGILALLDEECRLEQGSDRTFTEKLFRQFAPPDGPQPRRIGAKQPASQEQPEFAAYFRKPRFSNTAFTIRHYAHEVTYEGDGFLEKNRDTVPDEILDVLCSSSFAFVSTLASTSTAKEPGSAATSPRMSTSTSTVNLNGLASGRDSPITRASSPAFSPKPGPRSMPGSRLGGGGGGGGMQRRQAPTLAGVFKKSLAGLMATLSETEMHYIRCIKPNEAKAAWQFQAPMVLSQLRSCGVIETIRISKAGYPSRVPIRTCNERYSVLLDNASQPSFELPPATSKDELQPRERSLCLRILETCLVDRGLYQLGLTKVFLRAGQWAVLEKKRTFVFERSALVMQKFARGYLVRQSYARMRTAAVRIQRWYRDRLFARRVDRFARVHAVRVIESHWLRCCYERRRIAELDAAVQIQALVRGSLARTQFGAAVRRARERAEHQRRLDDDRRRKDAEEERQRNERARREAESDRLKQAAKAAREKAILAAAEQQRRAAEEVAAEVRDRSGTKDLDAEISALEEEIERAKHIDILSDSDRDDASMDGSLTQFNPVPRTPTSADSETVGFGRMVLAEPPTKPTEASRGRARQSSNEARMSLIAAGRAERQQQSFAPLQPRRPEPQQLQPTSSVRIVPPTLMSMESSIAESPTITEQSMRDVDPLSKDIYALINEFSMVSDGRYGAVDSHRIMQTEPAYKSPSLSLNHQHQHQTATSPSAFSSNRSTANPHAYFAQPSMFPTPGAPQHKLQHQVSDLTTGSQIYPVRRSWLHGSSTSPQSPNFVVGTVDTSLPPPQPLYANPQLSHSANTLPMHRQVVQNGNRATLPSSDQRVHRRQSSHSNMSLSSNRTQSTDIAGGRHTAARARAWASRQKDRMINAFSGDSRSRSRQTSHDMLRTSDRGESGSMIHNSDRDSTTRPMSYRFQSPDIQSSGSVGH